MPLVGHAEGNDAIASPSRIGSDREIVRAEQRRAGAGNLIQQRRIGGHHEGDQLAAGGIGNNSTVRHREGIRHFAFAAGNDQRVILHHVVGLRGDGVHVHRATDDSDGVVCAEQRRQKDVFNIVNGIRIRR